MSTHNICFSGEIRKIFTWYPLLSRPMLYFIEQTSCRFSSILTLKVLSKFAADNILKLIFFFQKKNKTGHFMWIVCLADNLHEMSGLISLKNKLSARQTIYMKCQVLFPWKIKTIKMSFAAVVISTLRLNWALNFVISQIESVSVPLKMSDYLFYSLVCFICNSSNQMGCQDKHFWVDWLQSSQSIHTPKFPYCCCPRDYHWPMKSNHAFVWNPGKGYFFAILVAVMSECSVKRVISKTWTGTLANTAAPDQMM